MLKSRKVKCKCPVCSKIHICFMKWTGRGMPRKYCDNCKSTISPFSHSDFHELPFTNFSIQGQQ